MYVATITSNHAYPFVLSSTDSTEEFGWHFSKE